MRHLLLDPKPSVIARWLDLAMLVLALAALWLSSLHWLLCSVLSLLLLACIIGLANNNAELRCPVQRIQFLPRHCVLQYRHAQVRTGLPRVTFYNGLLIALVFTQRPLSEEGRRKGRSDFLQRRRRVLLWRDSLSVEQGRQLRCYLRTVELPEG